MGMITRIVRRHNDGDDDGDGNDDDYGTNMVLMTASTTSPYYCHWYNVCHHYEEDGAGRLSPASRPDRPGRPGRPENWPDGRQGPQRQRTVDEASQPTLDGASSCFYNRTTTFALLLHHTACSTAARESERLSHRGGHALSTPRSARSTCRRSPCRTSCRSTGTLSRGTPSRSKTGSDPGEARRGHWSKRPPRPPRLPPQPASASCAPRRALWLSAAWPAQKVRGHWAQGDVSRSVGK